MPALAGKPVLVSVMYLFKDASRRPTVGNVGPLVAKDAAEHDRHELAGVECLNGHI